MNLSKDFVMDQIEAQLTKLNDQCEKYSCPKEALLQLHIDWQSLMNGVRINDAYGKAAVAAILLAAAAIKYVCDIGDPKTMRFPSPSPAPSSK